MYSISAYPYISLIIIFQGSKEKKEEKIKDRRDSDSKVSSNHVIFIKQLYKTTAYTNLGS